MILSFEVCNGLSNQRLGIAYGILLAKKLGAKVQLPSLQLDGAQFLEVKSDAVMFEQMYNISIFSSLLNDLVAYPQHQDHNFIPEEAVHRCRSTLSLKKCLQGILKNTKQLDLGCLFPSQLWDKEEIRHQSELFKMVLANLIPSKKYRDKTTLLREALLNKAGSTSFNFLHFRGETDWEKHCTTWESAGYGDNCFTDLNQVSRAFHRKGINVDLPIYVASDWDNMNMDKFAALSELLGKDYKLFTRKNLLNTSIHFGREEWALIEYHLGLESEKMIGNSVSTFTALMILERRIQGKWASQYNSGGIPLEYFVPLYDIPWVFSVSGSEYDYMLKAGVISAKRAGNMRPFCIALPGTSPELLSWLRNHSVTIIIHDPKWKNKLLLLRDQTSAAEKRFSHLYHKDESIIGTYLRIDIPLFSALKQYTTILYADTDVYFRQPWYPEKLPDNISTIRMGYEGMDVFPMNAGVYFFNMDFLTKTYEAFLKFIFARGSLYYEGFGPADQGALNMFYEDSLLDMSALDSVFNAKTYKRFDRNAIIVHFHGPKPKDFMRYIQYGECRFGDMCSNGLKNGACKYLSEWLHFVHDGGSSSTINQQCVADPGPTSTIEGSNHLPSVESARIHDQFTGIYSLVRRNCRRPACDGRLRKFASCGLRHPYPQK